MAARVRRKLNTTADDPAWGTSQLDPRNLRITVGGTTTAGLYRITLTPEDTSIAAINIDFTRAAEDDTAIAAGLAAAANVLAATTGKNFLRPSASTNSSAVLLLALAAGSPPLTVSLTVPGSATMTPDHTGTLPVVARGTGQRSLAITMVAVNSSGVPLAPGSGNANLQLLRVIGRTRPRGEGGPHNDTLAPAIEISDTVTGQALNVPWIVDEPVGLFTVRVDTDASMPVGISAIEVWAEEVETPLPPAEVTVDAGV